MSLRRSRTKQKTATNVGMPTKVQKTSNSDELNDNYNIPAQFSLMAPEQLLTSDEIKSKEFYLFTLPSNISVNDLNGKDITIGMPDVHSKVASVDLDNGKCIVSRKKPEDFSNLQLWFPRATEGNVLSKAYYSNVELKCVEHFGISQDISHAEVDDDLPIKPKPEQHDLTKMEGVFHFADYTEPVRKEPKSESETEEPEVVEKRKKKKKKKKTSDGEKIVDGEKKKKKKKRKKKKTEESE
ncbi:hypothetical protein PCE1_003964 [Barthelona sp. PCE]